MRALIVTCMRNEAPFLLEWIAYYRAIGFTDFLIYSNDCDDGTDDLLDRLAELGIVIHERNRAGGKKTVQWRALSRAQNHPIMDEVDWIFGADVDEYLNIHTGDGRLCDLLAACPDAQGFALPWRMFGNAGVSKFQDQPVTEQFTFAAPSSLLWPWRAVQFKSLYRADAGYARMGVHRPKLAQGTKHGRWVDGNGTGFDHPAETVIPTTAPRYGMAQINHYALGSIESFLVKVLRGKANHSSDPIDLAYWVERNFNSVEDRTILRHSEAIAEGIADLRRDHDIDRLHSRGVEWRERKIADLLQDTETFYFFSQLMQLGSTQVLPEPQQRQLFKELIRIRGVEKAKQKGKRGPSNRDD